MINPLRALSSQKKLQRRTDIDQALLRYEARVGGTLFGKVPAGGRREFFCLDEQRWIWHEEWVDTQGKRRLLMTRYEVRPHGIFKSQSGSGYYKIKGDELKHFQTAVTMYTQQIQTEYRRLLQTA